MNPLDAHKAMLDQLEMIAQADELRAKSLEEALRVNQGRHVAVVQVMRQIEEHAQRLSHPREQNPEGEEGDLRQRAMTELEGERLSGVNDALAYLRAEERAAQNNLLMGAGRVEELQASRDRNREEAKKVASRITAMLQEMARGVPHDMVGRPSPEGEVRRDIVSRKDEAGTVGRKRAPSKKSRG